MNEKGLTLLEMMIIVTIIGILATISIPRFGRALTTAVEGSTRGQLGAMRSAVSIYYSDNDGQYPADLSTLTANSRYLNVIPKVKVPHYHPDSTAVTLGTLTTDDGGWAYDNDSTSSRYGRVWINCSHTDAKGTAWSAY